MGFGRVQDNASGAEHHDGVVLTVAPSNRTIWYGGATGLLIGGSVCGNVAHVTAHAQ